MQSLLQIIKVNEPRSGTKDGRAWQMQDAECILLNDDGTVGSVGVLRLPKSLQGKVQTGTFTGSFALQPELSTRRIMAVLVDLTPVPPHKPATPPKAP